jgi:enoyl-CoA hydratase
LTLNHLKVRISDRVARVTFARQPANAVDQVMYREIAYVFRNLDAFGDDIRVVLLDAEGPHFCAGNDLEEFASMTPENGLERMWRVREAFFAIMECAVPVVGAVQGAALGTGLAIAASCDFVVAAPDAKFGLPELTVGVMGGARHLGRMAPQPLVRRMFFTGEPLTAEALADAGGAVVVAKQGELSATAIKFANRIASFSPTAIRLGKQILDRVETMDVRTGYEHEQGATVRMSGHPDSKEALRAFRERRLPIYRDRTALPFD